MGSFVLIYISVSQESLLYRLLSWGTLKWTEFMLSILVSLNTLARHCGLA